MVSTVVLTGFLLTFLAGISTCIGSAIILVYRKINKTVLSVALGFSAGVMIYVSFVEILTDAAHYLTDSLGGKQGQIVLILSFFGGVGFMAFLDKVLPSFDETHSLKKMEKLQAAEERSAGTKMLRIGFFSALAIAIHNFPEGIITFTSTLKELRMGAHIALAIAIHNIPEGIAIAAPIYFATRKRGKAFLYSFIPALAEPVGALAAFLLLTNFVNDALFGVIFASTAGIMIYISFDELLPSAQEYGDHHRSLYGLFSGMGIMALSLLFFS